jgi:TatD DNase family protein
VVTLIDVHSHLTDPSFKDIVEVLKRAKAAGVERVITSLMDPAEIERGLEIIRLYPNMISITMGFDPCIIAEREYLIFLDAIKKNRNNLVGIGEVGLDHFRIKDHHQRAIQESLFRSSIRLARSMDLPLIVHSRSAGKKALEVLKEEAAERVLMHAFDGKVGDALLATKKGYYFSIPTSVVYSIQKQKLARFLPFESLLLETDSPVLSPVRGERNEPANLVHAAEKIGELKMVSGEEVARITTLNAKNFFKL